MQPVSPERNPGEPPATQALDAGADCIRPSQHRAEKMHQAAGGVFRFELVRSASLAESREKVQERLRIDGFAELTSFWDPRPHVGPIQGGSSFFVRLGAPCSLV